MLFLGVYCKSINKIIDAIKSTCMHSFFNNGHDMSHVKSMCTCNNTAMYVVIHEIVNNVGAPIHVDCYSVYV